MELREHPHRRYNPLTDEWVLCSPHRTKRPWQGAQETVNLEVRPAYDPKCYLCPGNTRQNGEANPDYATTFVFQNDFSALLEDSPTGEAGSELLRAQGVRGECRVVCYSPRHDLTLGDLAPEEIVHVIDTWADQVTELGVKYRSVQVFENRGQAMGASNPHPHGQIWASDYLPTLVAREDACLRRHFERHGSPMLLDVLTEERSGERTVAENEDWLVLVPFWATWPFETLLAPKAPVTRLPELEGGRRQSLAAILKELIQRYDRVFGVPFPYSMGWHGAPTDGAEHPYWTLHAHFYPPLLRSATVRKWMVGFEMLAESQRDITPEMAAQRLRDV